MTDDELADRMMAGMLECAMGHPKHIVAEAATRCCIAILRVCARGGSMSMEAAMADIGMRMLMAAKGGNA